MKTSLFNVVSDASHGQVLIFNTLTLSLALLNESEACDLERSNDPNGDFYSLGFLAPSELDEQKRVEDVYAEAKARKDALSVSLVLTLACNFSCSYCSNATGHRFGMPSKIAEEGLGFIEKNLHPGQALFCTFYGGEPLLVLSEIEQLVPRVRKICDERNSQVTFDLLSNGFLLDQASLQVLSDLEVNSLQLSFDLPFNTSERRTASIDAWQAFTRTFSSLIETSGEFSLTLRFNVRRGFISDLAKIVEYLKRHVAHCHIELHHIFSGPLGASTTFSQQEEMQSYYDEYCKARRLLIESGLTDPELPSEASQPCSAVSGRGYFIAATGVRTCIREVTGPGATLERGVPNQQALQYFNYKGVGTGPCTNCSFLPVCNGGCPKDVRENLPIPLRCTPWRFTLKHELNQLLSQLQRRNNNADNTTVEHAV